MNDGGSPRTVEAMKALLADLAGQIANGVEALPRWPSVPLESFGRRG
jgi:hypothetical protein